MTFTVAVSAVTQLLIRFPVDWLNGWPFAFCVNNNHSFVANNLTASVEMSLGVP